MKLVKTVMTMLAVGAALVGCARTWDGELRWKVVAFHDGYTSMGTTRPPYANIKVDEEHPAGMVEKISMQAVDRDDLPPDIRIDDVVVCTVRQRDESGFDQEGVQTELDSCRRP